MKHKSNKDTKITMVKALIFFLLSIMFFTYYQNPNHKKTKYNNYRNKLLIQQKHIDHCEFNKELDS